MRNLLKSERKFDAHQDNPFICYCSDSPDPPDYSELAAASKESAEIMANLGYQQLAFAQQQYYDTLPLFQQIVGQQIGIADINTQNAQDDRDYMVNTFRPLEQQLVSSVQNFNTDAYRNQLANQASADAAKAYANNQAALSRSMASMGVNPNSGNYTSMQNQNALAMAASQASAMNNTRQQAENTGYARQLDVTGLGRNLTGASQGAYSLALNAGNSAGQNQMAPGNQYMQGMSQGASTVGSGQQMQINGLSTVANAQTSAYNAAMQSGLDVGGLMSGMASLYSASDRRVKENIELVGVDEATGLNLYEFNYIGEPSEKRYRGVMADEVETVNPDAVHTGVDGIKRVRYDLLNIEMVEV